MSQVQGEGFQQKINRIEAPDKIQYKQLLPIKDKRLNRRMGEILINTISFLFYLWHNYKLKRLFLNFSD